MAEVKKSQKSEVLNYLKTVGHIDSTTAINLFGAQRLSDIIFKLRKEGYVISSENHTGKNRYGHVSNFAVYTLIRGIENEA